MISEPAPGQDGKGIYTASFSNPLFTEQSKEVALPAVEPPAALTEAEIAEVKNAVNAIDSSDAANERSFGFLPGSYEVGTMAAEDGLHYRTLVSITDLDAYYVGLLDNCKDVRKWLGFSRYDKENEEMFNSRAHYIVSTYNDKTIEVVVEVQWDPKWETSHFSVIISAPTGP